ncbi:unnamed protein product [Absidia cylindrospora]
MTHINSKENKNLYTTGIIPTFTFVADGPDAQSKQGNGTKQHQRKTKTTGQIVTLNTCERQQQQQQKKFQKEHDNTNAKNDFSGPLHIIPSWQPLDANDKPPYSYATLIAHAILSSDHRRLTLCDIYHWITQHYPFYSMVEHGWKNSIRHNLSLNKAFIRVQRSSTTMNSGKGSYWTIRAGQELGFIDNLIKRRGPICKQAVILPRSLHYHRSSRLGTDDQNSSINTTARHINNSPLFTTFRMTPAAAPTTSPDRSTKRKRSMPELRRYRSSNDTMMLAKDELDGFDDDHDSDCDSGIDVSVECDKTVDRRRRYNKPQLKKAKSTTCLFSDSLDNNINNDVAAATTTTNYTFHDLLSTSSGFAAIDFTSPSWTNPMDLLTSSDPTMSPLLDWGLLPMMDETTTLMTPPDTLSYMNTAHQDSLLSPTLESMPPPVILDPISTFSPMDTLANEVLPFAHLPSYDTVGTPPPSSCVDSFSLDDYLLDNHTLMADWKF